MREPEASDVEGRLLLVEEVRVELEFCEGAMRMALRRAGGRTAATEWRQEPLPVKVGERRLAFSFAERKRLQKHATGILHGCRDEAS